MTSMATAQLDRPLITPMELLAHGVPLSLLLDLFCGPRSEDLLREETASYRSRSQPAAGGVSAGNSASVAGTGEASRQATSTRAPDATAVTAASRLRPNSAAT